jgi:hypothetical protein
MRNMSTLWSSLISAGAGLFGAVLGAVIGVIGALRASRQASHATLLASREASQQASQTAVEQVRFAVRIERKAQVMSTAYDKVGITRDKLAFLPYTSHGNNLQDRQDHWNRGFGAYRESSADAKAYLDRNAVWNDPGVDRELRDVLQECNQLANEFAQVLRRGTEIETGRKVLEERIESEVFSNSVNAKLKHIGHMLQGKLEHEKPR